MKEASSAAATRSGAPTAATAPVTPGGPSPSQPTSSVPTKAPMNNATFEIHLRVEPGPRLVAVLHNASSAPHAVVADSQLQAAELVLVGPKGAATAFDTRSVEKFDNTVHEYSFTTVAGGADAPLGDAKVQGSGGSAVLQWGPFRFESLPPGSYKAHVVLDSVLNEYQDDNHKRVKKADAWVGKVTSNEVTFQVP